MSAFAPVVLLTRNNPLFAARKADDLQEAYDNLLALLAEAEGKR
jgi:hypothetical protein